MEKGVRVPLRHQFKNLSIANKELSTTASASLSQLRHSTDQRTPTVWIGAFATGSQVVAVPNFFKELAQRERTVLALDMGATAFFQAVQEYSANIPCAVMKGVCDFADDEKDDAFHAYAAEAAARWMLSLCTICLAFNLTGFQ